MYCKRGRRNTVQSPWFDDFMHQSQCIRFRWLRLGTVAPQYQHPDLSGFSEDSPRKITPGANWERLADEFSMLKIDINENN